MRAAVHKREDLIVGGAEHRDAAKRRFHHPRPLPGDVGNGGDVDHAGHSAALSVRSATGAQAAGAQAAGAAACSAQGSV